MIIRQIWSQTLTLVSQQNPSKFIELLMLSLAFVLAGIWFFHQNQWPYLVLCASYIVGVAASIWVEESLVPSTRARQTSATFALFLAVLFAIFSIGHLVVSAASYHSI